MAKKDLKEIIVRIYILQKLNHRLYRPQSHEPEGHIVFFMHMNHHLHYFDGRQVKLIIYTYKLHIKLVCEETVRLKIKYWLN